MNGKDMQEPNPSSPPPDVARRRMGRGRSRQLTVLFAWLCALVLFLFFFNAVSTVLLGLLAAAVVTCSLQPMLRFVPGPRGLAAVALGLAAVALVGGLVLAFSLPLATPIKALSERWPTIQGDINKLLQPWRGRLGLSEPLTVSKLLSDLGDFLAGPGGQKLLSGTSDVVFGVLISLALIIFGTIFLLAEPADRLVRSGLRLLPLARQIQMQEALDDLGPRFRRWVVGTLTGMMIVFTASLLGYRIVRLEFALPLAVLVGLAEIVPTVGPSVAAVIVTLFAAATQGAGTAIGVLIVHGIIQTFEAYFILPQIMRGAVKIHPVVTLFTVVLWGKIFGVPGLILAIPINLTLWTLADHFIIRPRERRRNGLTSPTDQSESAPTRVRAAAAAR